MSPYSFLYFVFYEYLFLCLSVYVYVFLSVFVSVFLCVFVSVLVFCIGSLMGEGAKYRRVFGPLGGEAAIPIQTNTASSSHLTTSDTTFTTIHTSHTSHTTSHYYILLLVTQVTTSHINVYPDQHRLILASHVKQNHQQKIHV